MSIKTYRPTTPARRQMTVSGFDGVDKHAKPEKSLLETKKKNAGRNSYGRITVRHHGGGNRQKYRVIDFKRQRHDDEATVLRLEYDHPSPSLSQPRVKTVESRTARPHTISFPGYRKSSFPSLATAVPPATG